MAVPLQGSGRPRGVLSLMRHRDRRNFSQTDLAMAAGFASHASIALELADSRVAEQKLVLLEDRDRIAMDLHDHVIQELFAIGLSLEAMAAQIADPMADRLRQRVDDLDRTIRRIRTSIFELRGNWTTAPGGMRQQVLEVVSDLTAALGFAPHVAFSGLVDLITDAELAEDTSACIREMVSNVARHARATSAAIDVQRRGEELVITITDDGIGPPVACPPQWHGELAARAEKHGGSFEMTTASSGGTVATWKARVAMTEMPTPRSVFSCSTTTRSSAAASRELLERRAATSRSSARPARPRRRWPRIPAARPDVAVLDVRLPDGSGIDVCREIRSRLPDDRTA